jgi:hypothetical protein
MGQKRDIYVAVLRASKAGRGVRLSAEEVWRLANLDDAFVAAAESFALANRARRVAG